MKQTVQLPRISLERTMATKTLSHKPLTWTIVWILLSVSFPAVAKAQQDVGLPPDLEEVSPRTTFQQCIDANEQLPKDAGFTYRWVKGRCESVENKTMWERYGALLRWALDGVLVLVNLVTFQLGLRQGRRGA